MRFHIGEMLTPIQNLLPLAEVAEESGYAGYVIADSLLYPKESTTKYSYTEEGSRQFLENKPALESFVHASALAACTTRIEITTSVVKLPLRHPVYAAKLATSVAALSRDRFNLGVGLSVWPDDYAALGLPYERRGARLDECIEIVRGLATGEYFEFHGEFYDFDPIRMNPVPARPIPVIVGGHSEAALRRAARCDGWSCAGRLGAPVAEFTTRLAAYRREFGNDRPFRVFEHDFGPMTLDDVKRKEDAGITDVIVHLRNVYIVEPDTESLASKIDRFRRFADEVVHRL